MQDEIGRKIKYFRMRAKMTQEELAKGILSVSYLSKIEKEIATPSSEIIELLFKRLQLDHNHVQKDYTCKLCTNWFEAIVKADKEKASLLFQEVEQSIESIVDFGHIQLVEIQKLSYYLLTKQKKLAEKQKHFIIESDFSMDETEKYYWLKALGNYYFSKVNFKKALQAFQQAEHLIDPNQLYFPELEESDLFYRIARTVNKIHDVNLSITYGNKALQYYLTQKNTKRCVDCHILIGRSYYQVNEYDRALRSYESANQLASKLKDPHLLSVCHLEIGKLYSIKKESEKAIQFYERCIDLRKNDSYKMKLEPISSLIIEYYQKDDLENATFWLKKGLAYCNELEHKDSFQVNEIEVYRQLITGYENNFEDLILQYVLPYLEKKRSLQQKVKYFTILADYYYYFRKYKLSATYYKIANNTISEIHF